MDLGKRNNCPARLYYYFSFQFHFCSRSDEQLDLQNIISLVIMITYLSLLHPFTHMHHSYIDMNNDIICIYGVYMLYNVV